MTLSKLEKISLGGMLTGTVLAEAGSRSNNRYILALGFALLASSVGLYLTEYIFSQRLSDYFFKKKSK
jgi:hypothetical protein